MALEISKVLAHRAQARDERPRRARAYARQGEWFFIPVPELQVRQAWVRRNERLAATADGPVADYCVRFGGARVYVKGRVLRRGHKTLRLCGWHRVAVRCGA